MTDVKEYGYFKWTKGVCGSQATEASGLYIRIYSYICIILWFKFVHFFPVFDIIRHNCNKIVSGAKA